MIYLICFISLVVIIDLLIYFKVIDIRIGTSKSNDRFKINVVNNSYLDTLKFFISEDDYEYIIGKVIFFTCWSSFCKGSIEQIPALDQLQMKYSNNSQIVFISYCGDLKPAATPAFLKTWKVNLNFRFLTTTQEGLRSSLRTILSRNPDLGIIDPSIDSSSMSFIMDENEKVLFYQRGGLIKKDLPLIFSVLDKI